MKRRHRDDGVERNGVKEKEDEKREMDKRKEGEMLKKSGWANDFKTCCYCSLPLFMIYFYTLHPSVPGGDSGELITAAHELGVAHPPGYPLFSILAKLFLCIPAKSPAWRVNLMSAVFASLSSFFLQLSVLRLTKSIGVSLLIYPLFALNKVTWRWSVSAEVFSLNNFFLCSIITLIIFIDSLPSPPLPTLSSSPSSSSSRSPSSISSPPSSSSSSSSTLFGIYKINSRIYMSKLKLLLFLCGLSLSNHHGIMTHVVCTALWVLWKLYAKSLFRFSVLCRLYFFFLLGLLPYIYLLASSLIDQSRYTWGDQGSIGGLIRHLLRLDLATFKPSDDDGAGLYSMLLLYLHHVQHKMSELVPWLTLVGVVTCLSWAFIKKHTCMLLVLLASLTYTLLYCSQCNLTLHKPLNVAVIERYWLQTDVVVVILVCIGCYTAISLVVEKFLGASRLPLTSVIAAMFSMVLLFLQLKHFTSCDQSDNHMVSHFGRRLLTSMPPDALVLTNGALASNVLRYLHLVEGLRPDLKMVDTELLLHPWFLPRMREHLPGVTFPAARWSVDSSSSGHDDDSSFNFKEFLDSNIKSRQIFSCIGIQDIDPSWKTAYQAWPYGVCQSLQPITSRHFKMNPAYWANRTLLLADKWDHKYNGFEQTSWERAVNDEMNHAKVATAFYMYKEAMQTADMEHKAELLLQSYHLYFRAIKMNQAQSRMNHAENFPAFWHKNFALVCERLLHVDPLEALDKIRLCKMAIFHFEQYLHLEPSNADHANILQAIDVLKQRFAHLKNMKKADKSLQKVAKRLDRMQELSSALQQQEQQKQQKNPEQKPEP